MIDLFEDYWVYSKGTHPHLGSKGNAHHINGQGDLGSINTNCDDFEYGEQGFGLKVDCMKDPNGGYGSDNYETLNFYFSMEEKSIHYWGKYLYSEQEHNRKEKIEELLK